MASYKFLVVLVLFATCLSLANSDPFRTTPSEQTETVVNLNDETDAKEPQQYGGGYNSGRCRYGCCYRGSYGCIRCCGYPNEETNSVETSKRGRGGCKYGCCGSYAYGQCSACCSRTQVAEKSTEQEASP
ncbi:PREDICTED: CYC02 protein-like [Camelina sativa]|uniref:CYC02 protein-like n=1 Tax=Camelina sativa TaxID=90675 RepID=A0ABM0ZLZ3_CAMSA|nr:PREDICTED: CYC02 protein-like [Camelina sativa]